MTIEQYLKPFLKNQLTTALSEYNVSLGLDISLETMKSERDVIFQLKTTSATLSNISGIVEKSTPTQVYFKCATNYQQDILDKLSVLLDELNTNIYTTEDNLLKIELLFNTPAIITTQDEKCENDTILCSYGLFMLQSYATNLPIEPYEKYVVIDGVEYPLVGVQQYNLGIDYNYGYSQTYSDLGINVYQSKAINISLVLFKTNSEFCNYLETNRLTLARKELTIIEKSGDVVKSSINTIVTNISYQESTGVPVISITLRGI